MSRFEVLYRLPTMVIMQRDPLPPISFVVHGFNLTIHEPVFDDDLSLRGPWSSHRVLPAYRYGDIVRVEVDVPYSLEEVVSSKPFHTILGPVLPPIMQRFLGLLQSESRQAWLGHMPSPLSWYRYPIRYILLDENGNRAPGGGSGATAEPTVDTRFLLTAKKWEAIGTKLAAGESPDLPWQLWLDGVGFRQAGSFRSAVLSLAMACEVAMKTYLKEVAISKDPLYGFVVDKDRELSIFDYLDGVLELAAGQKPKDVLSTKPRGERTAYQNIRRLFEARNKAAHEGRAYFRGGSGKKYEVDFETLIDFEASVSGLLNWLDELRAGTWRRSHSSGVEVEKSDQSE